MPEDIRDLVDKFLQSIGAVRPGLSILFSLALAAASYLLVRYFLLGIILRRVDPKQSRWLNKIIEARIPQLLTLLIPPIVLRAILPYFSLVTINVTVAFLSRLLTVYLVVVVALVMNGVLHAINNYYDGLDYSRSFPITSILEVVRVVLFVLTTVVVISILFQVPAIYILAAIGTILAAGTVVFNNMILAFVSGLILTSKKMIMLGDWIELPELGINGDVREITLTTVIVRNLDHTIGTVPSAYLLAHSFKNWRGVQEEGRRKISWPVYFDINSVQPAGPELLEAIAKLPHGQELVNTRDHAWHEIPYHPPEYSSPGTNLGLFRDYCLLQFKNNPYMDPQRLFSIHIEAPTKFGIPMQVLVSTSETDYRRFLELQTGLVEDLLQLASEFGLKVFQIEVGAGSESIRRLVKESEP